MKDLLDQIELAINDYRLYYLSLFVALGIPDICGALESPDGEATPPRYKAWFDTHVAPAYSVFGRPPVLTGADCYRFRCSFLHQGRTQHHRSGFTRILFIEPGASRGVAHMNTIAGALNIDVRLFCLDLVKAARTWEDGMAGTEPYESNLTEFVRRHPNGLHPYIQGVPVIS